MSKNKLRGSGVLIVVLSAITFSIYTSSTYAEQQHLNTMSKKYEKYIVDYYERDNKNIEEIYQELLYINKLNENKVMY